MERPVIASNLLSSVDKSRSSKLASQEDSLVRCLDGESKPVFSLITVAEANCTRKQKTNFKQ